MTEQAGMQAAAEAFVGENPAATPSQSADAFGAEEVEQEVLGTDGEKPKPKPSKAPATPEDDLTDLKGRKFKVKLDGQEREVDLDTLIKGYQLEQVSHKRLQEAAKERQLAQQAKALFEEMRQNPARLWDVAKQLGHNPYDLAANIMLEAIEEQNLTPEQKEARTAKQEAAEAKKRLEEYERHFKQQQQQALAQAAAQEIDAEIGQYLSSTQDKVAPRQVARAVEYMLAALNHTGQRMPFAQAMERVSQDYAAEREELLSRLADEDLDKLPAQFLEKLRARDVARVTQPHRYARRPGGTQPQQPRRAAKPLTTDDFFAQLDKRYTK